MESYSPEFKSCCWLSEIDSWPFFFPLLTTYLPQENKRDWFFSAAKVWGDLELKMVVFLHNLIQTDEPSRWVYLVLPQNVKVIKGGSRHRRERWKCSRIKDIQLSSAALTQRTRPGGSLLDPQLQLQVSHLQGKLYLAWVTTSSFLGFRKLLGKMLTDG